MVLSKRSLKALKLCPQFFDKLASEVELGSHFPKTLIIAKSPDVVEHLIKQAKILGCDYQLISDIDEGMLTLATDRPELVIVEHSLDFPAAEPLATRFSELLMFKDSSIYMCVLNDLSQFENLRFNSLGFQGIYSFQQSPELFSEVITRFGKKAA